VYPLLAEVRIPIVKLTFDLLVDTSPNADTPRLCELLQPGRNIHPIAVDCAAFSDYIAKVHSHSKGHAPALSLINVRAGKSLLQLDSTLHRIDGTRELYEQAVAGRTDDLSIELGKLGPDSFSPQLVEAG
jgi:hypothetical protein